MLRNLEVVTSLVGAGLIVGLVLYASLMTESEWTYTFNEDGQLQKTSRTLFEADPAEAILRLTSFVLVIGSAPLLAWKHAYGDHPLALYGLWLVAVLSLGGFLITFLSSAPLIMPALLLLASANIGSARKEDNRNPTSL